MSKLILAILSLVMVSGYSTFAADTASPVHHRANQGWTPTPEQRQQMAKVHEDMAACLRTDKPITECRKQMMSSCQKMSGKGDCPMMHEMREHMHGMRGMMNSGDNK